MSGMRRIHHARLECAGDGYAWRARALLEDAMRTASFGDEGRLLLVRQLALGRLSPGAGAQEWSLRCEERFRALREVAVAADAHTAASADAVFFRDEAAMWTALAVRTARGLPCLEWFWQVGARGWAQEMTRKETLQMCFARIVHTGGIPATIELATKLVGDGRIDTLLADLSPDQTAALLPKWRERIAARNVTLEPAWQRAIARTVGANGAGHPLARWLATVAVLAARKGLSVEAAVLAADDLLNAFAADVPGMKFENGNTAVEMRSAILRRPAVEDSDVSEDVRSDGEAGGDLSPVGRIRREIESTRKHPVKPAARRSEAVPTGSERPGAGEGEKVCREVDETDATGVRTEFGGLFFLVPLFARLGAAEMPHGAAWLALRLVLRHFDRGDGDALNSLLPEIANDEVPCEFSLRWPVSAGAVLRWRGATVRMDETERLVLSAAAGEEAEAGVFPADVHPAAAALALGAHRLCRKLTRLGLRTVVFRPARVIISRTHVDIFLRLGDVDPRIRCAALDCDPGWVPWLGRAVTFHYTLEASS